MTSLEFRGVSVTFGHGARTVPAVRQVDLVVPDGRIVGLIGESGSGKSTLARAAVGLCEPTAGQILLGGTDVVNGRGEVARRRRSIQMIFQDPYSCLDPRMSIGQSIEEALRAGGEQQGKTRLRRAERAAQVAQLLDMVKIDPARQRDVPNALSGGQRQRVAIARALAADPEVLLADEITSALDVSVQGAVLNLLRDVQQKLGLTVLFISHNMAVVRYLCDDVAVMYQGEIIETGPTLEVIERPAQSYTKRLLAAVPEVGAPIFQ